MKENKLEFELQSRVRRYLEYTMKNESDLEDKNLIMKRLTKALRTEVLIQANKKLIEDNKFFQLFSAEFREKLILCLRELSFSPEEHIFKVAFIVNLWESNF